MIMLYTDVYYILTYMHLNRLLHLIWVNRASVCLYRVAACRCNNSVINHARCYFCAQACIACFSAFSTINASFQSLLSYTGNNTTCTDLQHSCNARNQQCAYREIYRISNSFKLGSNIFASILTLNYTKNKP